MASPPFAFTFWDSEGPPPTYIELCLETQKRNLSPAFKHIHLDFETCRKWVPARDELWEMARPKSGHEGGRRWALFCGLLRVHLIRDCGGLWVDADTIVYPEFSRLASLVDRYDLVGGETARSTISNAVLGARRDSPFFSMYAAEIAALYQEKLEAKEPEAAWGQYGFRLLQKLVVPSRILGLAYPLWVAHVDRHSRIPADLRRTRRATLPVGNVLFRVQQSPTG